MFGVTAPFYDEPVETMAFNLWAMEESRKDELREIAAQMAAGVPDHYSLGTQYLSKQEVDFIMEEFMRLKGRD